MNKRVHFVVLCVTIVVAACAIWLYHDVRPYKKIEYRAEQVAANLFTKNESAVLIANDGVETVGVHLIRIKVGARIVPCVLNVQDTTPPTAKPVNVTVIAGQKISPEQFISELNDASIVEVAYKESYNFDSVGEVPVIIRLTDICGNTSTIESTATVVATKEIVCLEAGSAIPTTDEFVYDGFDGNMETVITEEVMHSVGEHQISIMNRANNKIYYSTLEICDSVAPEAEGGFFTFSPDETIFPESVVKNVHDETGLTYTFVSSPNLYSTDIQSVSVNIEDEGGNVTTVNSEILITDYAPVIVEASNSAISAADIGIDAVDSDTIEPNEPGTYYLKVNNGQYEQYIVINVRDTTAPDVHVKDKTFYTFHEVEASAIVDVSDVSPYSVEYLTVPDWNTTNQQSVTVKACDIYGNEKIYTFMLQLAEDKEAPKLYGITMKTFYVEEPIMYYSNVKAEDNVDSDIDIKVTCDANMHEVGTYVATYTATDKSGNSITKQCKINIVKKTVSEDEVKSFAQKTLSDIITPDMVTVEKLQAIFVWIKGHIRYTGSSDKNDWRKEAVRGMTKGEGDCFTVYAVTKAFLDELGINYMSVKRQSSKTRHYWVIINIGTGWYHFDALKVGHRNGCFMWTNKQCGKEGYYWRYDHSQFPDIATEPFDYDEIVRMEKEGLLP